MNWCPAARARVSDLEVKHRELDDTLTWIRYPLADGDGHVTIATVRPPTMLADVAVAVHPDDERYRDLVGKEAIVPIAERRVPIIADERVDLEFGTGALRSRPAHDPMDWEIGRDHDLPEPMVIGLDGRMNEEAGELAGLTQAEAERAHRRAGSQERGLLEKRESLPALGRASATAAATRIEPLDLAPVVVRDGGAGAAGDRGAQGRPRPLPPGAADEGSLSFLENIRPWCISRQLWWGHRIPVWYCPDGHTTVAETRAGGVRRVREGRADAGARTCSTPGSRPRSGRSRRSAGPSETPELAALLPGRRCSRPARDIIFLWVSRMILAGLELHGRDAVPRRNHPRDDPGAGRPADVEEPRHRASTRPS